MGELMTIGEVAEFLKINPEIVRRKIRGGQIRGYKIGKSWRVSEEEIKNFLKNCLQ